MYIYSNFNNKSAQGYIFPTERFRKEKKRN